MSRPALQTVLRHATALAAEAAPDAELLRRFAADRDDAAFAALVARHGPMVWGVCRNLLPHDSDAEDAFQATFLALVRGAGTVRQGERFAGWLHGVAVRVALKARRSMANRRRRERAAAGAEAAVPVPDAAWDELLAAVHEEVRRLPEALRTAFVICSLEGVRQPDAAARLGWKPGTLTARLTRAKQQLLAALARRGITPAIAAGAVAVGAAPAPADLAARAAGLASTSGTITPTVLNLAQGVIDMNARVKWMAAALLAAAGLTTTIGTALIAPATAQRPGAPPAGADNAPQPGGGGTGAGGTTRGGGFGGTAPAGLASRAWEYKVVDIQINGRGRAAEEKLNELGAAGWELCMMGDREAMVFKRPKAPAFGGGGGFGGFGGGGPPGGGGFPGVGAGVSDDMIQAALRRYDRNGDGKLSKEEAAASDRLLTDFATYDTNKDGSIDATEYKKYAESRPTTGRSGGAGGTNQLGSPGAGFGGPGGFGAAPAGRGADVQVIRLKNADATELARLLKEVYARTAGISATADARTNSLLVTGDAEMQKTIKDLIDRLDVPASDAGPRRK